MDGNTLFFSLLFSVIGIGFFSYGKKHNAYFLISGILLMVFPYFVSSLWGLVGIGTALVLAPFILAWLSPL